MTTRLPPKPDRSQPAPRKRRRRREPTAPCGANGVAAADGVAEVATRFGAEKALRRTGAVQRAQAELGRGMPLESAVATAAKTGKGALAEVQQVASYNARAAAFGKPSRAAVNPIANAPRDDVFVRTVKKPRQGHQLKTAAPEQLRAAIEGGKYPAVVVPTEHHGTVAALGAERGVGVSDCLASDLMDAEPLSIVTSDETTRHALTRILRGTEIAPEIDRLAISLKAGASDALVGVAVGLVVQLADAAWHGRPLDLGEATRAAVASGAKAGVRTAVQTRMLLGEFTTHAHGAFRSRLAGRVAASAMVAGAVAEVVVETAFDFVAVLRGQMTREELFRRAGVHTCRAVGGLAGVAAACALTRNAPGCVTLLACIVFGAVGAYAGEEVGEALFQFDRALADGGEDAPLAALPAPAHG